VYNVGEVTGSWQEPRGQRGWVRDDEAVTDRGGEARVRVATSAAVEAYVWEEGGRGYGGLGGDGGCVGRWVMAAGRRRVGSRAVCGNAQRLAAGGGWRRRGESAQWAWRRARRRHAAAGGMGGKRRAGGIRLAGVVV
jgi:hypothetical protein